MTKQCAACKVTKSLAEFSKNASRADGLHTSCRTCKSLQQRLWYQTHKTEQLQRVKARNNKHSQDINQFLWDYLSANPCIDCGESDPVVLEFDHVRGVKSFNLSKAAKGGYSLARIKEEIVKCDVRCVYCHRRKTATQLGWYSKINKPVKLVGTASTS